jgi:hypothetical protein
MTIQRNPPTVAEHLAFGRAIKQFALSLGQMATGSSSGLGTWRYDSSSPQAKALLRVEKALSHLKSVMDSEICAALPERDHRATHFYYGVPAQPATQPDDEATHWTYDHDLDQVAGSPWLQD